PSPQPALSIPQSQVHQAENNPPAKLCATGYNPSSDKKKKTPEHLRSRSLQKLSIRSDEKDFYVPMYQDPPFRSEKIPSTMISFYLKGYLPYFSFSIRKIN